jgi:DNA-binding transcriptional LysR family regulator
MDRSRAAHWPAGERALLARPGCGLVTVWFHRTVVLFRQLEYFVALAREKHFARAAAACYVSQPALSEAIRKLERELGVPLVNRGRAFEGLTPEGERLVWWARRIIAAHDALKLEADAMHSGLTGRLRIGVIPAASTTAALIIEPFCSTYPLVSVSLETRQSTTDIAERLDRFELDAGIAYLEGDVPGAVPLYTEQQVLLASRDLVPDSVDQLAWSELSQLPLCMLSPSMRGRQVVDKALGVQGPDLRPEVETDSIAALYSLAASGHWTAVVPYPWFHQFAPTTDTRFVPLVGPTVTSRVGLLTGPSEPGSVLGRAFTAVAETIALDELFAAVLAPLHASAHS